MRYDRQITLDEVGDSGQEKLSNSSVLIIGVGGLGCPAAQYLVGAGIGKIALMDHDKVSISNLHRQVLYNENDIGRSKAMVSQEKLQQLNSEIEIVAIDEALSIENAEKLFSQYDLILDGTDNFETKYLINDACILANKPWVYASIYKNEGQLSVFNYQNGPSYRCLFPKTTRNNVSCEATGVLGVVPGIFGMLQAMEVLKILLGVGNLLSGKLKISNLLIGSEQIMNIQKREKEIEKIRESGIIPVIIECKINDNTRLYLDIREIFEQPKITSEKVIQIPMSDLDERLWEIPKEEEIFVFCQSGKRSKKIVDLLKAEYGFENLNNVEGGIETIIYG
ncbi:HesA/MoeB/ThiF family protein [Christiangramia forsetii]|uniref:Molybdopterin-synthase adenylyltransferase n=2 Tax=Christiangramia forsetii TaxID=411153 RepID=A0LYI9_CHRFK|nr:HesA/MoeB/ThiF family protein [Christiangramia forsetii]GGG34109.1 thiazole biosynthesis adenylyltransferase ThiF [Christiangramia forsetii]CAL65434.1 molybdenum cofactor biosynthesis protein [Christiangramia forsetii KT0803]